MEDLLTWLNKQNSGVKTYEEFRVRAKAYQQENTSDAAAIRLLINLADEFIWAYADEPLPRDVGAAAFEKLKDFMSRVSHEKDSDPARRLALLNEIATTELVKS